jgi:hypothetical protein
MKADAKGTPVERCRAAMGWKGSAERKAAGANPVMVCANCHFSERQWGGSCLGTATLRLRCVHPCVFMSAGMATRDAAGCDRWEARRT